MIDPIDDWRPLRFDGAPDRLDEPAQSRFLAVLSTNLLGFVDINTPLTILLEP